MLPTRTWIARNRTTLKNPENHIFRHENSSIWKNSISRSDKFDVSPKKLFAIKQTKPFLIVLNIYSFSFSKSLLRTTKILTPPQTQMGQKSHTTTFKLSLILYLIPAKCLSCLSLCPTLDKAIQLTYKPSPDRVHCYSYYQRVNHTPLASIGLYIWHRFWIK